MSSGGGGGLGGGKGGDTQGGITPEQMALTEFTFGGDVTKNASNFSGMPMSTGLTQADAGAQMKQALSAQGLSQADANALNAYNQQGQQSKGLGNLFG